MAEGDGLPELGRVVARALGLLPHREPAHLAADAGGGQHELVDEPGVHAAGEQRRVALAAGLGEARLGAPPAAGDQVGGAHDVDPGLEEPADGVGVLGHGLGAHDRVVADDVRAQGQDLVDVAGREDAERLDADELADVAARLLRAPRVRTHQFHVRVLDDRPSGEACDVAGGPQDDAVRHGGPFRENSLDRGTRLTEDVGIGPHDLLVQRLEAHPAVDVLADLGAGVGGDGRAERAVGRGSVGGRRERREEQLRLATPLEQVEPERGLVDGLADGQEPVVLEEQRLVVAQRARPARRPPRCRTRRPRSRRRSRDRRRTRRRPGSTAPAGGRWPTTHGRSGCGRARSR